MGETTVHIEEEGEERPAIDSRFVPLRAATLAERLAPDTARMPRTAPHARRIFEALDAVIGQETARYHEHLDQLYEALNPDADTLPTAVPNDDGADGQDRLLDGLQYALEKANFEQLSDIEIKEAIQAGCSYGVRIRVDPSRVEHLELHVRGHGVVTDQRRRWRTPWKRTTIEVPVYRRLVVVAQLASERGIRLKLFRDIPMRDVDGLLPHAEIQMSLFDRAQIFGGGLGSLGGVATKLLVSSLFSVKVLIALVIGLVGLTFKSFFGYRRKRAHHTSTRTKHLYDRNLANNAAVLHSLLRMIHQEELKEALLSYCLLVEAGTEPLTEQELDRRAERWVREATGQDVDFDAADALETLTRLGLCTQENSVYRAVPIERSLDTLEAHRSARASRDYHTRLSGVLRADWPSREPKEARAKGVEPLTS